MEQVGRARSLRCVQAEWVVRDDGSAMVALDVQGVEPVELGGLVVDVIVQGNSLALLPLWVGWVPRPVGRLVPYTGA